jgi:uncharacterized protein with PIN domain
MPPPNKIKPAIIKKALRLYQDSELSNAEICRTCGISWGTLYNYSKREGIKRRGASRHRSKPIKEITRCPKCKDVEVQAQFNTVDFRDTANGVDVYKTAVCDGCKKEYFKTADFKTGETKIFLLR